MKLKPNLLKQDYWHLVVPLLLYYMPFHNFAIFFSFCTFFNYFLRTDVPIKWTFFLTLLAPIAKLSLGWAASKMRPSDPHFWFFLSSNVWAWMRPRRTSLTRKNRLPAGRWVLPVVEPWDDSLLQPGSWLQFERVLGLRDPVKLHPDSQGTCGKMFVVFIG